MHHSVELKGVDISIGGLPLLRDVNIEAMPCEMVAIIGANGTGKTTLLKVTNGTFRPDRGKVYVMHQDLFEHKKPEELRKEIAVVPQKSNSLRFPIKVEDAVLMGRYGKIGIMRRPKEVDRSKAYEAMSLTGITSFAKRLVHELSGGEQQKVALARALAQEPQILLLDEPTTFLDAPSKAEIMETIHNMHRQRHLTTIMVSHEEEWVKNYANKVYLLRDKACYRIV
ncbi:MAG: ABC transporter ATP-binding protein [Syntrophorhabdaceae bacterium]|nr:ABC transporter ATP-binding protein [Syntrophorhabdaceae bacterium]